MLALIYLGLALAVGDFLCRRFYRFASVAHRCGAAVLVGLLVSSWFTYLAGLAFAWTAKPLLWGNLLFGIAAIAVLSWNRWKHKVIKRAQDDSPNTFVPGRYLLRPTGSSVADWLLIAGYVVLVSWMMFASFNSSDGILRIANQEYSDFGPNTAIMQSFAVGHNFPTEYPHFSGDRIRYHFLFYFQAGNLEFLGLSPVWSLNLLSLVTLVAMLTLAMTLGEVVFNSRAVGRLGSLLFFFFGSLSYVPYLQRQGSVRAAIQAIRQQRDFLPSIFPYRGDAWGTWSQVTYLNQRHVASAIGILLLVLIFLVIRYRMRPKRAKAPPPIHSVAPQRNPSPEIAPHTSSDDDATRSENILEPSSHITPASAATEPKLADILPSPEPVEVQPDSCLEIRADTSSENATQPETSPESSKEEIASVSDSEGASAREAATEGATEPKQEVVAPMERFRDTLPGFIFSGVLLGLLPMWNSAVFIGAAAVLGVWFILFPLRLQMLAMAVTTGLIALPQLLYLTGGSGRTPMPRLFHWGYTIDQPTAANVVKYLGFTFGFKWLLIALALVFANSLQRRLFLAVSSLVAVAFCFQFTIEVLANQKFIHTWVIIANLFVAFALWRLWRFSLLGTTVPGKLIASVLFLLVIPGGVIDFLPIHNTGWSEVQYRNDPLIDWLKRNTTPRDIFLTDRFVTHPILMAGRRVFYGWPYFAWSAGYNASNRDRVYTELFESKDPWKVYHLLKENGIEYVAYDNAVRQAQFIKRPNQELYATYFPKVYDAPNYNGMVIYKVPDKPPPKLNNLPESVSNMFEGGKGTGKGEFDSPSGIAVDSNGNVLVADTGNGRIEKFSPTSTFISTIGMKGAGNGQLGAPNGIAVDRNGNVYIADAGNHRVQKLAPNGGFIAEWKGPEPGFYGPRRIAIGPDDSIYVVDQGHTRIVKFKPDGQVLTVWGTKGNGDAQFDDPTSVAVDPTTNKVYVADPRNKRIQVFDASGKFLTKWEMPEWGRPAGFEDLAIDAKAGRLYASSANINAVFIFDLNGNRIGSLTPKPPDQLEGPSALALRDRKLYVANMFGNRVSVLDL
jgi:DNA-binding beta-propeller fold protein YncE